MLTDEYILLYGEWDGMVFFLHNDNEDNKDRMFSFTVLLGFCLFTPMFRSTQVSTLRPPFLLGEVPILTGSGD